MTTIVKGGYSGKEEFDVKIIDTQISDALNTKAVYRSRDDLKTWVLTYKMRVEKVS